MQAFRGLTVAFAFFAGSFALHILGGATDEGWLFAIAVGLIYFAATGFPAIALIVGGLRSGGGRQAQLALGVGTVAGLVFTIGALWATNGRAFAWWEFVLAPALVSGTSAMLLGLYRRGRRRCPRPRAQVRSTLG
ncbi:MAG: hypothetical protein C0506_12145 [Anaerolinea sp.]|nr:hypothetical protein [Anaerolinea sp.]